MFDAIITSEATRVALPVSLVMAVCKVESGFNPWAWNPEPQYRYLWDVKRDRPFRELSAAESANERPPIDFPGIAGDRDQEWWGQQASWGLMQVMGAVARERRFREPYLPQLCDPLIGVAVGCDHLASLVRRFKPSYGWDGAIAAYNAGSVRHERGEFVNQEYVNRIRAALLGAALD